MAGTNDSLADGTSSIESKTMTRGVLLFAFDNEIYGYRKMAEWSAQRIHRHLDLPVTLVTDEEFQCAEFDKIITTPVGTSGSRYFDDAQRNANWYNHSRPSALDLSPYDETLLLDVDYVVSSNRLMTLFDCGQDFLAHAQAWDVTGNSDYSGLNRFGRHRMPMSWATVIYFRKSHRSSMIFDIMNMVRDNWKHYCDLYALPARNTYRNDFALSIALNIVNGHDPCGASIPWSLASVDPHHSITVIGKDEFRIEYTKDSKLKYITVQDQDLHVMGKRDLEAMIADQS